MSSDIDSLRSILERVFPDTKLEPISDEIATTYAEQYPGIPEHYLQLLKHFGWGDLGQGSFMIYSGPIEAKDIFGPDPRLSGIWLIGDDFAGWCLGLNPHDDWCLIGIDNPAHILREDFSTVTEFMTDRLANETES
jgi:hypothetical protein